MLRFTLFALAILIVATMIFGSKMNNIKAHHTDSVSQAEQIMSN